jgi:hypothetical protein
MAFPADQAFNDCTRYALVCHPRPAYRWGWKPRARIQAIPVSANIRKRLEADALRRLLASFLSASTNPHGAASQQCQTG